MLLVACKLLLLVFFNILCLQMSYVIMWLNVSDIVKWWAAGTQVFIFVRRTRFQTYAVLPSGPSPGFRSRGAKKSQGGHIFNNIGCMQKPGVQPWNGGSGTTGTPLATALSSLLPIFFLLHAAASKNDSRLCPKRYCGSQKIIPSIC